MPGDDSEPRKLCPTCKPPAVHPLSDFGVDKSRSDGRRGSCKACVAAIARQRRTDQRNAGIPPPAGKKVRERSSKVVSLDKHRRGGSNDGRSSTSNGQPTTPDKIPLWPLVASGPDPDTSWYPIFLESLAANRNVTEAAERAGIHRATAYAAAARDSDFAEVWKLALAAARDRVEGISWERALNGWTERTVRTADQLNEAGEVVTLVEVTETHRYDASMLRLILQGVAPEYRRAPTVAVQVGVEVHGSEVREKLTTIIDGYAAQEQ